MQARPDRISKGRAVTSTKPTFPLEWRYRRQTTLWSFFLPQTGLQWWWVLLWNNWPCRRQLVLVKERTSGNTAGKRHVRVKKRLCKKEILLLKKGIIVHPVYQRKWEFNCLSHRSVFPLLTPASLCCASYFLCSSDFLRVTPKGNSWKGP